jgi:outer membrane immunogenic protein
MLTIVASVAMMAVAPASAANLIINTSNAMYDPAPAANWTGFYAGAFIGAHAGTVVEYVCSGVCAGNFPLSGLIGGLEAGYDYQLDQNWVLGGFVQLPLLKPTGSATAGATFTVEPQWAFNTGARIGYAIDRFLPYAHVGLAIVNNRVTSSFGAAPTATHTGLSLGMGVEAEVADNITVDGRYTFTTLGAATYDWGGGAEKYGENSSNFTVSVKYRF